MLGRLRAARSARAARAATRERYAREPRQRREHERGRPGLHRRLARRGRAAARLARHRARRRQLAQHAVDGRQHAAARARLPRGPARSRAQHAAADRSAGLELLLGVDEHDREDASALQELVRHCTRELGCVTGALLVPDKNLEFSCSNDAIAGALAAARPHAEAPARVGAAQQSPHGRQSRRRRRRAVQDPLVPAARSRTAACSVSSRCFAPPTPRTSSRATSASSSSSAARPWRFSSSEYDALTGLANRLIFERRAQRALDRAADGVAVRRHRQACGDQRGVRLERGRRGHPTRRRARSSAPPAPDALVEPHRRRSLRRRAAGGARCRRRMRSARRSSPRRASSAICDGSEALPVSVSIGAVVGALGERLPHVLAAAELACKRAKRDGGGRARGHRGRRRR